MDDFSEDALRDVLEGLYAWDVLDGLCTHDPKGSVVWVERLRTMVKAQLSAMSPSDRVTFFAKRFRDRWPSEEARAVLSNLKDAGDFWWWLDEHMECPL